jgi:hypothetical protein
MDEGRRTGEQTKLVKFLFVLIIKVLRWKKNMAGHNNFEEKFQKNSEI